ncbi:MAG: ethanolamine ammonia-lyase subunit EutB [Planctomycetia bacterium]
MRYQTTLRGEHFVFDRLAEVLAKANEEKSGDQLAGLAAASNRERVAAKMVLADLPLRLFLDEPVVDPATDDVTRAILETHDAVGFAPLAGLTVGEYREFLLSEEADGAALCRLHRATTPEMAAAAAKLMSNKEMVLVASKIRVVTRCRNTVGGPGVLAVRLQPNHPNDDLAGILWGAVDGLTFGCGDAVIGINPAADSVDAVSAVLAGIDRLVDAFAIPTQGCCLAHATTQLAALDRGAPVDLLFQSVAGTQAANASFGVTLSLLKEGREKILDARSGRDVSWVGPQCMYFETGQGSALSADAHHGVDQLTLEARAYGVARLFDPFLVNTVVGFIGPEYLYDERQITRAGLEDHFMGKLLGLPMGCDVCYTNHAAADQNTVDNLLLLLCAAGVNYVMGVPASDDVMLNYQSTSYHDAAMARRLFNLRPAPEFLEWLEAAGLFTGGRLAPADDDLRRRLAAGMQKVLPAV